MAVDAGKGTFTAAVEVQEQQRLVVSFLHHQPVQRLSHNPLERQDVVGVTNYLDVGLQARLLLLPVWLWPQSNHSCMCYTLHMLQYILHQDSGGCCIIAWTMPK